MCGPLPHRPNNQHRGHAMLHSRCIGTHRRALLSRFSICFCVCCLVFRFALCLYLPFGAHTGNSGHHHQPYTNHTYLLLYAPVCVCVVVVASVFVLHFLLCSPIRRFACMQLCHRAADRHPPDPSSPSVVCRLLAASCQPGDECE